MQKREKKKLLKLHIEYQSPKYPILTCQITCPSQTSFNNSNPPTSTFILLSSHKTTIDTYNEPINNIKMKLYTEGCYEQLAEYHFCEEDLLIGQNVIEKTQYYCRVKKEDVRDCVFLFGFVFFVGEELGYQRLSSKYQMKGCGTIGDECNQNGGDCQIIYSDKIKEDDQKNDKYSNRKLQTSIYLTNSTKPTKSTTNLNSNHKYFSDPPLHQPQAQPHTTKSLHTQHSQIAKKTLTQLTYQAIKIYLHCRQVSLIQLQKIKGQQIQRQKMSKPDIRSKNNILSIVSKNNIQKDKKKHINTASQIKTYSSRAINPSLVNTSCIYNTNNRATENNYSINKLQATKGDKGNKGKRTTIEHKINQIHILEQCMDGDVGNNRNCNIHDNADKNKNIHDGYIINSHTDPIKNNPKQTQPNPSQKHPKFTNNPITPYSHNPIQNKTAYKPNPNYNINKPKLKKINLLKNTNANTNISNKTATIQQNTNRHTHAYPHINVNLNVNVNVNVNRNTYRNAYGQFENQNNNKLGSKIYRKFDKLRYTLGQLSQNVSTNNNNITHQQLQNQNDNPPQPQPQRHTHIPTHRKYLYKPYYDRYEQYSSYNISRLVNMSSGCGELLQLQLQQGQQQQQQCQDDNDRDHYHDGQSGELEYYIMLEQYQTKYNCKNINRGKQDIGHNNNKNNENMYKLALNINTPINNNNKNIDKVIKRQTYRQTHIHNNSYSHAFTHRQKQSKARFVSRADGDDCSGEGDRDRDMDLKQDKEDVGGADRVIRNTFNNILNYRKYNKQILYKNNTKLKDKITDNQNKLHQKYKKEPKLHTNTNRTTNPTNK